MAADNVGDTPKLPHSARLTVNLDDDNFAHFRSRCPVSGRMLVMAPADGLLAKKLQVVCLPNCPEVGESRHAVLPRSAEVGSRSKRRERDFRQPTACPKSSGSSSALPFHGQ